MRILIIANSEIQKEIVFTVRNYSEFSGETCELIFDYDFDNIASFDRVVIDEFHFGDAWKLIGKHYLHSSFYVYLNNTLYSLENTALLERKAKELREAGSWAKLKKVNKVLKEIMRVTRKTSLVSYPIRLQLESTSMCNARCIMCSHYYSENRDAQDMSESFMEKIKELLPYLEVLIMHGNGEPFVSKYFDKCIETYSDYGIVLSTNTNLSILTDKQIDYINKSFVDFRVSCDGCTKEIYEGIRKNLSFDLFIRNAEKLRDRCPSVTKTMASVAMRQNIQQIPEMVEFAKLLGFSQIIFSNLGTSEIVKNEYDNVRYYPYYAAKQFRDAIRRGNEVGISVVVPESFDLTLDDEEEVSKEIEQINSTLFFKSEEEISEIRSFAESIIGDGYRKIEELSECYWEDDLYDCEGICEWCLESPYIDLDGNVFVCCINATYRVGNIYDYDSFMDLWNNDVYQKIRQYFYDGKLPGFCDNCQFLLNKSVSKVEVKNPDNKFFIRRRISKFYHDYCLSNGIEWKQKTE